LKILRSLKVTQGRVIFRVIWCWILSGPWNVG